MGFSLLELSSIDRFRELFNTNKTNQKKKIQPNLKRKQKYGNTTK